MNLLRFTLLTLCLIISLAAKSDGAYPPRSNETIIIIDKSEYDDPNQIINLVVVSYSQCMLILDFSYPIGDITAIVSTPTNTKLIDDSYNTSTIIEIPIYTIDEDYLIVTIIDQEGIIYEGIIHI